MLGASEGVSKWESQWSPWRNISLWAPIQHGERGLSNRGRQSGPVSWHQAMGSSSSVHPANLYGGVGGHSALRDPKCYSFLLCAVSQGFFIPYQFLENRSEKSSTQFSGLRSWERAPAWIPFSDSLQWPYLNVICSVMPLVLKIVNAFWPFEDCYLLGFVFVLFFFFFLLPKAAFYEDIWTGVSANKAPLFHSRLGSLASLFLSTPVPRSWSTETMTEDVLKDWMWKMRGQRLRMASNLGDGWGWYSLIWKILN